MKIYDTKKEAMEAAEAFAMKKLREGRIVDMVTCCEVRYKHPGENYGWSYQEFHYKPERVAPANGQAVMDIKGRVGYSAGIVHKDGAIPCSVGRSYSETSFSVYNYTPVDIIPAGQFAKEVELLEIWLDTYGVGNDWTRETSALLDEIKAGCE